MNNTPSQRILLVLDSYLSIIESHKRNLVMVVNDDLHLVKNGKSMDAVTDLYFLYNLSSDPEKAYQIMEKMRSIMHQWYTIEILRDEDKQFYFDLMYDIVIYNFRYDKQALFYVDRLILDISSQLTD